MKSTNIEFKNKGDAQQLEIEVLMKNNEHLEKMVIELDESNDKLEKKNQNLSDTVAGLDAHLMDDIESIKRVNISNLLYTLYTLILPMSP